MRQELLAYGYKPAELKEICARDVVDFMRGLRKRIEAEASMLLDAVELGGMIACGKWRRKKPQKELKFSPGFSALVAEYAEIDRVKALN